MHVLLITHHYLPEDGAPQRRWSAFSARFVAEGHRVTVLAPPPHHPAGTVDPGTPPEERPGGRHLGPGGETVHRVRCRDHGTDLLSRTRDHLRAALSSVTVGIRRLHRKADRPDVIVATAPGIPSIGAGFLLSWVFHAPLVVEMRDAWPDLITPSGMWGTSKRRGWKALVTRLAHVAVTSAQRHAAVVVTTTVSFADVLHERRMPRVEVVRNCSHLDDMDLPEPDPDRDELRILYLGTLGRSQGLRTAVDAADRLHQRGIPVRLRLIGTGQDEPRLRAAAERSAAPIEVWPRIPRDLVAEQYAWADTVLVSLRAWDPFEWTVPSKMYEAMASGRHISAALAGEAELVIRESRSGDVVPPEDPDRLAELWEKLRADRTRLLVDGRGRQWLDRHADPGRLAQHYVSILQGVIA